MSSNQALQLAISLHGQPSLAAELRGRPLPVGVSEVLRLASGHAPSMATATVATGLPSAALLEACRFFVEQQLLSRECEDDPWRSLGVDPGAEPELIREHRRLLVGLVHPDRGEDWAAAFSDRVNRAWRQLKTPEGRKAALVSAPLPQPLDMFDDGFGGGDAIPAAARRNGSDELQHEWAAATVTRPATVEWQGSGGAEHNFSSAGSRGSTGHRSVATALAAVSVLVGAGLIGWNLLDGEWRGDEVLVPMGAELPRGSWAGQAAGPERIISEVLAASDVAEVSQPEVSTSELARSEVAKVPSPVLPDPSSVARQSPLPTKSGRQVPVAESAPPSGRPNVSRAIASESDTRPALVRVQPSRISPSETDASGDLRSPSVSAVVLSVAADADNATAADSAKRPVLIAAEAATSDAQQNQSGDPEPVDPIAQSIASVAPDEASEPNVDRVEIGASLATVEASSASSIPDVPAPLAQLAQRDIVLDDFSNTDVERFLGNFARYYASGDLSALIGLFAIQANSAKGGSLALAADYARLFESTHEREIAIRQLTWRLEDGSLRGDGQFEATYYKKGRLFRQVVRGQISFVIVEENGVPRILRLDSHPG